MKKIFIGLLMGVILTLSASAFANSSVVGKVIQGTFPLFINGERASQDVIVVEGTSYLPVRSAGEMFGYNVDFQNNTVILSNQTILEPQEIQKEFSQVEEGEVMSETVGIYLYKSDVLDLWHLYTPTPQWYLEKDGNTYIPISLFYNYQTEANREKNVYEFPNGKVIEIINPSPNMPYEKDAVVFVDSARSSFVKLSAIGYNAEIRDGEVWIVE